MSFIDSPLARCEAMRQMVLTDETQLECAREHDCPPGFPCPLCDYFVEPAVIEPIIAAPKPRTRRRIH